MNNVELRAPRRRAKKERDNLIPILVLAVIALGGGFWLIKHYAEQEQARIAREALAAENAERLQVEKAAAEDAEIRRRIRSSINESRMQSAPSAPTNTVTTESGRTYYVQPNTRPYGQEEEISTAERYRRASEIMQQSRDVQRQIDASSYGGGAANAQADAGTANSGVCVSLRREKEALDERMRRYAYGNAEGEWLHEKWRSINRAMVQAGC